MANVERDTPDIQMTSPAIIAGVVVGSNRFLRMKELQKEVGLSRATIYNLIAEGSFPRGRKIGARCVAWPASEIENWKSSRPLAAQKTSSGGGIARGISEKR